MSNNTKCPKCEGWLIKKPGKYGGQILTCPNWPKKCTGHIEKFIAEPKEVKPTIRKDWSTFQPSKYQQLIADYFLVGDKHIIVNSTAGSGKTTMLEWLVYLANKGKSILLLAFGRDIADVLRERITRENVKIDTFHSFGYWLIRIHSDQKVKVDNSKIFNYLKNAHFHKYTKDTQKEFYKTAGLTVKLVTAVQSFGIAQPDNTILENLADSLGINLNGQAGEVFSWTIDATNYTRKTSHIVSYADMVDYAWFNNLISQPYDLIFVDEAQDANEAQLDLIARHTHKNTRITFVGDRNQAIFAFRGGDNASIDRILVRFNPEQFIMPISYRNSKAIARKVNELLPHIEHYATDNAPEGLTADIDSDQFAGIVKAGDMVLCKHNAPLIKPAWQLISKGIKAVIIGKDIGSNMGDLIKKFDEGNIDDTLDRLQEHKLEKAKKLNAAGKFAESELFTDIADSAINLLFELSSVENALKFIDDIFSEKRDGVSFSSIHKAKGLEAKNVFILKPELLKTGIPTIEEKASQERNITFVALTRGIENMYFVRE